MDKNKQKLDLKRANYEQIIDLNSNLCFSNDKAEILFTEEREKWSEVLTPLYKKLSDRNIKEIIFLQSDCLSIREQLQVSISSYSNKLSKAYVSFKNSFGDRMEFYMTGFGVKTANTERVKMIDRDLAEVRRRVELLETHIDFLKECRYSCDQVQYAVKNIVGLITYLEDK